MRKYEFEQVLCKAVSGNHEALEIILETYKDLIEKHSYIHKRYDEDLQQYISIHIALNISKFKI